MLGALQNNLEASAKRQSLQVTAAGLALVARSAVSRRLLTDN